MVRVRAKLGVQPHEEFCYYYAYYELVASNSSYSWATCLRVKELLKQYEDICLTSRSTLASTPELAKPVVSRKQRTVCITRRQNARTSSLVRDVSRNGA